MAFLLCLSVQFLARLFDFLNQASRRLTLLSRDSLILGMVADLRRSKAELITENTLLRQQLIVLQRQVQRPRFTPADRLWFVLLASRLHYWKEALLLAKPDTLLRWHRQGFRLFWKFKSRSRGGRPQVTPEIIALIQRLTAENRLWGAERIRGELLKLGLSVAKGTIQKYLAPYVQAGLLHKAGRPFSRIMPRRSGRVTFSP
jgi:putative transposase